MATDVLQHVRGAILAAIGFFSEFIFSIIAANFLEICRKHVFTASDRNIIKKRVKKRNKNKFCQKVTVFYFKL